MSFWKKLSSLIGYDRLSNKTFEQYRQSLLKENLTSLADLEKLVVPLIKKATKIIVQKATPQQANTQTKSHFGGQPYFELGEDWPQTKDGNDLQFVFQVFKRDGVLLPPGIQLVQFYYDWETNAFENEDDGWLVKTYENLDFEKMYPIETPTEIATATYCEVSFQTTPTLPDWEGIEQFSEKASQLSCVLNEDEPWESYQQIVQKLIGEQVYQSQIGGYPTWVQGDSTPLTTKDEPMNLLFQIDSEGNANLMWGDAGLVYVFYDESSKEYYFEMQCH
jgi:uncharacterized protein YwqG